MALKRMIIKDQQRPELLINELTVMKKCRHPNIVQYYSSHLIDEELWIIMVGIIFEFLCKICGN
jgi:serine/threonine protein kinase